MPTNFNNSDEVVAYLKASRSQQEWEERVQQIKAAHNGNLPSFWLQDVVMPGLWKEAADTW